MRKDGICHVRHGVVRIIDRGELMRLGLVK
jgi:hypothetical protein